MQQMCKNKVWLTCRVCVASNTCTSYAWVKANSCRAMYCWSTHFYLSAFTSFSTIASKHAWRHIKHMLNGHMPQVYKELWLTVAQWYAYTLDIQTVLEPADFGISFVVWKFFYESFPFYSSSVISVRGSKWQATAKRITSSVCVYLQY